MFKYLDYIPLVLISLLFASELEIKDKPYHIALQLLIVVVSVFCFFILVLGYKKPKYTAFSISAVLWLFLVYMKQCHICKNENI